MSVKRKAMNDQVYEKENCVGDAKPLINEIEMSEAIKCVADRIVILVMSGLIKHSVAIEFPCLVDSLAKEYHRKEREKLEAHRALTPVVHKSKYLKVGSTTIDTKANVEKYDDTVLPSSIAQFMNTIYQLSVGLYWLCFN